MAFLNTIRTKFKSLFDVAKDEPPKEDYGTGAYYPIHIGGTRSVTSRFKEDDIISVIYNRIAVDATGVQLLHCKTNEDGRYQETLNTELTQILTVESNLDQSAETFKTTFYYSLCEEGCVAIVPTFFEDNGEIAEVRVAKITQWYAHSVEVEVYDEDTMRLRRTTLPKRSVAIVENPFAPIMSSYSSTAKRIARKLKVLDSIDTQLGSGKLDLIIQLPYGLNSPRKQGQAAKRQSDIAAQLKDSEYGIAYIDGTEKVVQLNRPLENNLLAQVESLTKRLFSQLGLTEEILNGTAPEDAMNNYYSRIIDPIVSATVAEMHRKFISREDRDNGEAIKSFRDPLKLVSPTKLADIADKYTRNEVATSNEIRSAMGWKPSTDPRADELRNSNLNHPDEQQYAPMPEGNGYDAEPYNF